MTENYSVYNIRAESFLKADDIQSFERWPMGRKDWKMSRFTERQTHELMVSLEAAGFTHAEVTKFGQYPELEKIRQVLKGKAEIVPTGENSEDVILTPFSEIQTHLLMKALEAAKYTTADVTSLCHYHALRDFRLVLNGKAEIVPIRNAFAQPVFIPESGPLNFDIYVDRTVRPIYPVRTRHLMNPDLACEGPQRYHLSSVELWLHYRQTGLVRGQVIYDFLVDTNTIGAHLNLQDGLAIQKKGITVFRKFFQGKAVFLWKSVIMRHRGRGVPFLVERGEMVVILWRWLDYEWNSRQPALKFGKLT